MTLAAGIVVAVIFVYGMLVAVARITGTTLVGGLRRVFELSVWSITTLQVSFSIRRCVWFIFPSFYFRLWRIACITGRQPSSSCNIL